MRSKGASGGENGLAHIVAARREVQGGRPAAVAIATNDEHPLASALVRLSAAHLHQGLDLRRNICQGSEVLGRSDGTLGIVLWNVRKRRPPALERERTLKAESERPVDCPTAFGPRCMGGRRLICRSTLSDADDRRALGSTKHGLRDHPANLPHLGEADGGRSPLKRAPEAQLSLGGIAAHAGAARRAACDKLAY